MAGRNVLVTGGGGYVGSVLVQHLIDAGMAVRVLDALAVGDGRSLLPVWGRNGFEFVRGDVRDARMRSAALEGMDSVVHLAAIVGDPACSREPEKARAVNLEATRALTAEAARAGVERFVFASTCSNYGKMADGDDWVTEDWELRPVSLYAETKVAAELEIMASTTSDFATTCLRLATVYGVSPRMRFDLTVNEFARDALLTRKLVVYGEQFWRPYVHVVDAARAIVTTLDAPTNAVAGEVFNVGSSTENFRKQDLIELLLARVPDLEVDRVAQPDDPRDYRVSFSKIEAALGYGTRKTVPQGLDDVIAVLDSAVIADPFADLYRN